MRSAGPCAARTHARKQRSCTESTTQAFRIPRSRQRALAPFPALAQSTSTVRQRLWDTRKPSLAPQLVQRPYVLGQNATREAEEHQAGRRRLIRINITQNVNKSQSSHAGTNPMWQPVNRSVAHG